MAQKKIVLTFRHIELRRLDGVITGMRKLIEAVESAHNLLVKDLAEQLVKAERERSQLEETPDEPTNT